MLKWQDTVLPTRQPDVLLPGSAGTFTFVSPRNTTLTAAYITGTGGSCSAANCSVAIGGAVRANVPVTCTFTCDNDTSSASVSFGLNGVITTSSSVTVTSGPVLAGDTEW